MVTPDRLASPRTLTRELQANQGGRTGQCSACAVDFVCVCASFAGLLPSQSHGPLRRLREAYSGPLSAQRVGQSLARQVRAVLRVQM